MGKGSAGSITVQMTQAKYSSCGASVKTSAYRPSRPSLAVNALRTLSSGKPGPSISLIKVFAKRNDPSVGYCRFLSTSQWKKLVHGYSIGRTLYSMVSSAQPLPLILSNISVVPFSLSVESRAGTQWIGWTRRGSRR